MCVMGWIKSRRIRSRLSSCREEGRAVTMPPAVFSMVPVEVWADRRLTLEQLRVLGALLSFCGPDKQCFPSRKEISKRSRVHIANVSTATTALERLGWLTKVGKGGFSKANRYRIHVPETLAQQATVAESATVVDQATVAESASSTVAQQARGKEQTIEQTNVGCAHPITSKAVTAETGKRSSAAKGSRLPADWQLPKAWGEWAQTEVPGWSADHVRKVGETFGDYWRAKAGRDAAKADWLATWRNWVRREAERTSAAPARSQPTGAPDPFRGAL